ncbi:MAG: hypothetical protein ACKVVT_01520 [Dehalococcoidia bacterium]
MRRLILIATAISTFTFALPTLSGAASIEPAGPQAPMMAAAAPPAPVPAYWLEEGEGEHGEKAEGNAIVGPDVVPGAAWAIVGIFVGGLILGVLYLLKRRVGGFPAHPSWVAPISIERSATFATDGTFGESDDAHGHGSAASSHH